MYIYIPLLPLLPIQNKNQCYYLLSYEYNNI